MTTIRDLKEAIKDLPDDMLVVMSSDSEGNSHSPFSGYSVGMYVADSSWSGSFYSVEDYKSEVADEWIDEGDGVEVLCLWPTN